MGRPVTTFPGTMLYFALFHLASSIMVFSSPSHSYPFLLGRHGMEYGAPEYEQRWRDDFFSQEYSPGLGLGLLSVGKRSAPKPEAFVRKYREDRPTYMTNHADAAMRSLG